MTLSMTGLKGELDTLRSKMEDDLRRLEDQVREVDHELRDALEARCQGLLAEVNRWHGLLQHMVGERELAARLDAARARWEGADEKLEAGFREDVNDLKRQAAVALERIRKEWSATQRGELVERGPLTAQPQSPPAQGKVEPPGKDAHPRETVSLKEYIDYFNTSSARARGAVYVVAVTSLIVFSTFWNVRPGSWLQERVKVAREIEALVKENQAAQAAAQRKAAAAGGTPSSRSPDVPAPPAAARQAATADAAEANPAPVAEGKPKPGGDAGADAEIHRVLLNEVIQSRRLDWPGAAQSYREKLEELLYVQAYQVRIPFFGVSYDINDLGMLGGFAFFVVLMILRFSLARELANLRLVFHEAAERHQVGDCFKLLSMGQVLTVPRHTNVTSNVFTRNLHRSLYVLPILILGMIMWHDVTTLKFGLVFSSANTILTLIFSAVFYIINFILTYQCLDCSYRYDKTWEQHARAVKPCPPP